MRRLQGLQRPSESRCTKMIKNFYITNMAGQFVSFGRKPRKPSLTTRRFSTKMPSSRSTRNISAHGSSSNKLASLLRESHLGIFLGTPHKRPCLSATLRVLFLNTWIKTRLLQGEESESTKYTMSKRCGA